MRVIGAVLSVKSVKHKLCGVLLGVAIPGAAVADFRCHQEKGTNAYTCIATKEIRANASLRSAPLHMGGPKGVDRSGYTLVTDCARQVATIQDRKGVNFGGGANSSTDKLRMLTIELCMAEKPKTDPTLRQF